MTHLRKRHALALLPVLAGLGGASTVRAEPPAISAKEEQARHVLAQVNELNRTLGHSVEAYDRATWQLRETKASLKVNAAKLAEARQELARAQRVLAQRAVAIYESGQSDATLELLLGARSLGQLLDEYDAVRRIAAADVRIVRAVSATRERVTRERRALERSRSRQARLVAEAAAHRASIQQQLGERSRLLSSIRGEIARLKADEAARQERLRREALARLAAQKRAEELARKRAAEEAARAEAARREATERARKQRAEQAKAAEAAAAKPRPAPPTTAQTQTAAAPATTEAPVPPPAAPPAPPPPPAPAPPPAPPASTDVGVAAETPEGASVAPPPTHGDVVGIALRYLGIPYRWAGASPDGFDCSGFTMYIFAQVGVPLPHYAEAQFGYGVAVPRDQLAPGDLVFFDGLTHVGIYIGGGQFVHSPHTGDVVKISSMSDGWYAQTYDGARRL